MTQNVFTGLRDDFDSLISWNPNRRRRRRPDRVSTEQLEIRCLLSAVVDLVADLNTSQGGTSSLTGRAQITVNSITFFTASTLEYGDELWRTDGTDEGTFRLTDIMPGPGDSDIRSLTRVGDLLFFAGAGQNHGNSLWRSDGTVAGTQPVLQPMSGIGLQNSSVMPVIGDSICFFWGGQLWTSDGTDQGTRPYFDIPEPMWLTNFSESTNGIFYFSTSNYDSSNDTRSESLWISDGTSSGTRIAKTFDGYSAIWNLKVTNGQIFATVVTGAYEQQIWTSDGTNEGTTLIADVSWYSEMTVTEDSLFFTVQTPNDSRDLWAYNYINQSLIQLTDNAGSLTQTYIHDLVPFHDEVFFVANGQLWRTNGTIDSTTLVPKPDGVYFTSIANINGSLVLSAFDSEQGGTLWISDGTADGTSFLKDLVPGTRDDLGYESDASFLSNGPSELAIFYGADESGAIQIWGTDATSSGSRPLAAFAGGTDSANPSSMASVDGELVFLTGTQYYFPDKLWSSQSGTPRIVDQGSASELGLYDGDFYYLKYLNDDNNDAGIYRWNGINGEFIQNIMDQFYDPSPPLRIANETYFLGYAYDPVRQDMVFQLRQSINGGADSRLVKEFQHTTGYPILKEFQFFTHNDLIYFRTEIEAGEPRLWRSDGTPEGTYILMDSYAYEFDSPKPFFEATGNEIILTSGGDLIVTDGSAAGTHKLLGQSAIGSYIRGLGALSNMYLFRKDGMLWKTDGTEAGTMAVTEFPRDYTSAATVAQNCLYFSGYSDVYSYQTALWKSDGTASGTQIVFRFSESVGTADLENLQTIGQKVLFTILDETTGYRTIWISDGTPEGTLPLHDNSDGKLIFKEDAQFTLYNDGIAFVAATPEVGYEVFRINTSIPVGYPTNLSVTGNPMQTEVVWPDVPGAIQYDVWLQRQNDSSQPPMYFRANDPRIDIGKDLPVGTYQVRVRSLPVLGEPSPWSVPLDIVIADAPEVVPPDWSTSTAPVLRWTGASKTASYQIQIADRDTNTVAIDATDVTGNSYQVTDPLAPGNYAVWVRGKMADQSFSSWSAVQEFRVLKPAIRLTSDTGELNTSRPQFEWPAVDSATGYDVEVYLVDTSSSTEELVYGLEDFRGLSFIPAVEFPAGEYRIYITALQGTLPLSERSVGDLIWLTRPTNGLRVNQSEFTWYLTPFAGPYTDGLQDGKDDSISRREKTIETAMILSRSPTPGQYSNRAVANSRRTASNVSTRLNQELWRSPVTITSSSAGTVNATPTISWTPAAGALTYEIFVTKLGSEVPVYTRTGIKETSHRIDVPLTNGLNRIQVQAIYSDGSRSSLSKVQSLQTGIGTALLYADGTVSWDDANGATHYELWLNRLGDSGRSMIVCETVYLATSYVLPPNLPKGRYQTSLRPVRAESGLLSFGAWTNVTFEIP